MGDFKRYINALRDRIDDVYQSGRPYSVSTVANPDGMFKGHHTIVAFKGTSFQNPIDREFLSHLHSPDPLNPPSNHIDIAHAYRDLPQYPGNIIVTGHSAGAYKARVLTDVLRDKGYNVTYVGFNGEVPEASAEYIKPLEKNDMIIRHHSEYLTNLEAKPGDAQFLMHSGEQYGDRFLSHGIAPPVSQMRRFPVLPPRTVFAKGMEIVKGFAAKAYQAGLSAVRYIRQRVGLSPPEPFLTDNSKIYATDIMNREPPFLPFSIFIDPTEYPYVGESNPI